MERGEKIRTISDALSRLDDRQLKRLATLVALGGLGEDKPQILVLTCLTRARFCERIAPHVALGERQLQAFLTGMYSALDAIVERPLGDALHEIGMDETIARVIAGDDSVLSRIYALVLSCERANWRRLDQLARELGLSDELVMQTYSEAMQWADRALPPPEITDA